MDIMMFIIFLVTDLFLIFCFQFAFSSGYRYQNGMYLGVHIPADHKDDPDVSDLITSSRQSMKHFQIINTLISIAICFINFASIAIFAMVYCVWIFELLLFHCNAEQQLSQKNVCTQDAKRLDHRITAKKDIHRHPHFG